MIRYVELANIKLTVIDNVVGHQWFLCLFINIILFCYITRTKQQTSVFKVINCFILSKGLQRKDILQRGQYFHRAVAKLAKALLAFDVFGEASFHPSSASSNCPSVNDVERTGPAQTFCPRF